MAWWFEETREGKTQSERRRQMHNLHKHVKKKKADRRRIFVNMNDYTKGHLMCNLLVAKSAQMFALCIQRQPRGTLATNICPNSATSDTWQGGTPASALPARRSPSPAASFSSPARRHRRQQVTFGRVLGGDGRGSPSMTNAPGSASAPHRACALHSLTT